MSTFIINGGNKLYGEIVNQTSKNASLPILSASIMCEGEVTIFDAPNITDVENMLKILSKLGVTIERKGKDIVLNPKTINNSVIDEELSKTMRSSLFLLGSMLNRFKCVDLTLPGGCKIGKRPIDISVYAFKKLGVEVTEFNDHVKFVAKNPKANKIKLRLPSVGATENIVQFACLLKGKTTIINAAREPEVVDLCNFLNQMGAKILGAGTSKITIYGVDKLSTTSYRPIGDRIVAGTVMCAVALCGGEVTMTNAVPYQNLKLIEILKQIGCQIDYKNDIIQISREGNLKSINEISTGYYPDFPTDLQSFMLVLSCLTNGETIIKENIFENRFLIVPELNKMGANIKIIDAKTVKVSGVDALKGTTVKAMDLRGGASLVLAGLVAKGETRVENMEFIFRGYENLDEILVSIGANIRKHG